MSNKKEQKNCSFCSRGQRRCGRCGGRGVLPDNHGDIDACSKCHGSGKETCGHCNGTGKVNK